MDTIELIHLLIGVKSALKWRTPCSTFGLCPDVQEASQNPATDALYHLMFAVIRSAFYFQQKGFFVSICEQWVKIWFWKLMWVFQWKNTCYIKETGILAMPPYSSQFRFEAFMKDCEIHEGRPSLILKHISAPCRLISCQQLCSRY